MKADLVEMKIKSLEEQLRVLRYEVEMLKKQKDRNRKNPKSFAELRGIWKGERPFTEEEIENAKIRVKDFPE